MLLSELKGTWSFMQVHGLSEVTQTEIRYLQMCALVICQDWLQWVQGQSCWVRSKVQSLRELIRK